MDFSKNYENLLNQMNFDEDSKKVTHNINKNTPLLPFKSREPERVTFDNGFYPILGEVSRLLLNKEWENNLDVNNIISGITKNDSIDIEDSTDKYLEKLLKEYLFKENDELKILNSYLYLYVPLSEKKRRFVGEMDMAIFFRDIFCRNNNELVNFFENNGSNHIIIDLILNNIANFPDKTTNYKYESILPSISNLFTEDIVFAVKHEKFLIENIIYIFAYYYFFYITQLIIKLNKDFNANIDEIEEFYYLLDWENVSKNRKTLKLGYHFLREKSNYLFAKVSVIDQLNTLFGTKGLLLPQLYETFENMDDADKSNLIYYLKEWVSKYRIARGFEDNSKVSDNFKELVNFLFESLNDDKLGIARATKSRYSKNVEEIAKAYFTKRRGSYGYVLNITRDMLLVLTTLCVKDEKIKLKQLFIEYEKRGLYFDRYSQEKIVDFLTKLNLIDKKSDSGDAQYVKPIL